MDRWTNIVDSLLKSDYKHRHKSKPVEMINVAAGTLKRLKGSLRHKKNSRLTEFDSGRNLSSSNNPVQLSDAEKKLQKRKEQLIKWKQERELKKQMAAGQKKKPFVVGIVHQPLIFAPPPPVPRYLPSTSGRVTRSQSARVELAKEKVPKQSNFKSFAPQNAVFHPPKLNITTYPILRLDANRDKQNTKKIDIHKAVEDFTKKLPNSKQSVTRSLTTKLTQNAKAPKAVVHPQEKESSLNKGEINKVNVIDKTNRNLRSQMTTINKNSKTTKTNVNKTAANRINGVPKVNENSVKTKKAEFLIEANKVTPKKVRNKPKRVQTPKRPVTKGQSSTDEKSGQSFSSLEDGTCDNSNSSQEEIDSILHRRDAKNNENSNSNLNATPKSVVPKSESGSEEKLKKQCGNNSIMTPEQIRKEAERISPCVILSRGKDNARRELKQKLEEGLIDEMGNIESVHHFRQQLNSEIVRMTKMCETWDQIFEKKEIPVSVQEQILSATGQARLLMSQKFQQFSGLVDRCAAGEDCIGGGLVTPTDLQGFWDMLFIQVENIDLRFIELEKLKQRGWTEDEQLQQLEKKPVRNKNVKRQSKPATTSRLREMIAASRKALKEQPNSPISKPEEQKEYCVSLPFSPRPLVRLSEPLSVKSVTPRTPSSTGRSFISSEAQRASARKSLASYAMLRASQISKSVEIEGISPLEQTPKNLTPINLQATPARSILKSKNTNVSDRKLTKTVLFDNHESDCDMGNNSSIIDEVYTIDSKTVYNQTDENLEMLFQRTATLDGPTSDTSSIVEDSNKRHKDSVNRSKKKILPRQEAFDEENVDTSRIMIRRRRQNAMVGADAENSLPKPETEKKISRSSKKKKALQEIEVNIHQGTDLEKSDEGVGGKSTRRRQRISELGNENVTKTTPRKSNRRSGASIGIGENIEDSENIHGITPRRSSRKRQSKVTV